MKRFLIPLALFCASTTVHAQEALPPWFTRSLIQLKINFKYELKGNLKPEYLIADFDGDGRPDVAILANERRTKKGGIIIMQRKGLGYAVIGAGQKLGNGSDNLKKALGWKIYQSKAPHSKPEIFIYGFNKRTPKAGWLIYWDGHRYSWIRSA